MVRNISITVKLYLTNEVRNEIEIETEEEEQIILSKSIVGKNIQRSDNPINPTEPCKVFIFPIGNAIAAGASEYEGTRRWWRITEQYRDVSEYEFAVGLKDRISISAYKLKRWNYNPDYGKCEFEGEEITELKGFSWYIQTSTGYWNHGNHLVVEFDGKGKFRRIRPKEGEWINC